MPAPSKAAQAAAAIALHHPEKATGAAKNMATSMTKKELRHHAKTSTKNLPKHVKKESFEINMDWLEIWWSTGEMSLVSSRSVKAFCTKNDCLPSE